LKNRDLCERPGCRYRWVTLASGRTRRGHSWTLRVCLFHAEIYMSCEGQDSVGNYSRRRDREGCSYSLTEAKLFCACRKVTFTDAIVDLYLPWGCTDMEAAIKVANKLRRLELGRAMSAILSTS
jgi:hypothetical protein